LTKPDIIGLGHQALDQPDSFLKACDFTGGGEMVEHRAAKENAVQVTDDPILAAVTVPWVSIRSFARSR
jgi:hypothetical protein